MTTKAERVNLVHHGQVVDSASLRSDYEIKMIIHRWLSKIKPVLKKGEKVTIEVELIGK